MNARTLIENDDLKAEAMSYRADPSKKLSWRDELYELGFKPTVFDKDLGEEFPLGFQREWNGHEITIKYHYEHRQWVARVDGMTTGMAWNDFDDFLWYLSDKIMVARFDRNNT